MRDRSGWTRHKPNRSSPHGIQPCLRSLSPSYPPPRCYIAGRSSRTHVSIPLQPMNTKRRCLRKRGRDTRQRIYNLLVRRSSPSNRIASRDTTRHHSGWDSIRRHSSSRHLPAGQVRPTPKPPQVAAFEAQPMGHDSRRTSPRWWGGCRRPFAFGASDLRVVAPSSDPNQPPATQATLQYPTPPLDRDAGRSRPKQRSRLLHAGTPQLGTRNTYPTHQPV